MHRMIARMPGTVRARSYKGARARPTDPRRARSLDSNRAGPTFAREKPACRIPDPTSLADSGR